MERQPPAPGALTVPVPARDPVAPAPVAAEEHDARWHLEQYVRSFDDDDGGAEYYRLIVDAHAVELVDAIAVLAVEPMRPVMLRLALVRMLARSALRGDPRVLTVLLAVLRQNGPDALADGCLQTWGKVADPSAAPGLADVLWTISSLDVRGRALQTLIATAGDAANAILLRLFTSAPDPAAAALLLNALDGVDLDSALAMFERASHAQQPVRLAAAHRIGHFDDERFPRHVDAWLTYESDPEVVAALQGARRQQQTGSGWSAMQATGPPDADPDRDDPKAWAPRDPEMGRQWLELRYAAADRVNGVRIHEVNSPGAVAEVSARDDGGQWHVLWRGTTAAGGTRPLTLTFATTPFATSVLRIVLDTDRRPGWNEIDAVELLGQRGGQFARRASASSSYAQRAQVQPAGRALSVRPR
jgi:hypothetical protein